MSPMSAAPAGKVLAMAMRKMCPEYGIMWKKMSDEEIVAKAVYGKCSFVNVSALCTFRAGQDWVGNLYGGQTENAGKVTVLWDTQFVDPRSFLRKHAAMVNGIISIIFVHDEDGGLQELGFKTCADAENFLSLLNEASSKSRESMIGTSPSIPRVRVLSDSSVSSYASDSDTDTSKFTASDAGVIMTKRAWTDDDVDLFRRSSGVWEDTVQLDSLSVLVGPASDTCPWPSIGSKGHPHSCGQVCKYAWKKTRGCRDGNNCTRCHICRYSKEAMRNKQKELRQVEIDKQAQHALNIRPH